MNTPANCQLVNQKTVKKINRTADFIFSYGGKITDIILKLGVEKSKIIEYAPNYLGHASSD